MQPAVTDDEDEERVQELLERCPVGGLILFNGSVAGTPALLERLQSESKVPLLIGSDIERGLGQQVRGGTVFPHAMAYAALGDRAEHYVEQAARITALEALACGVHIAFAPDADVNRNMSNPIISTRAYGTEPDAVARLIQAYIRGAQAEGMLTTGKHFPGHGNTSEDSHEKTPVVPSSRSELWQTDLVPFRAAIEAGVDLIMTAHVAFPALDPEMRPGTLSKPILTGLLREELGYQGAVISDSMLMGAVQGEDPVRQACSLILAGADIILDPKDPEMIVEGLVQAVERGVLDEARLDESVRRVLALKHRLIDRLGADVFTRTSGKASAVVHAPEHQRLAEEVAYRAVQVFRAGGGIIPLDPVRVSDEGLLAVVVKPFRTRLDPPEAPLGEAVRMAFPGAVYAEIGPETTEDGFRDLEERAQNIGHVVLALVVKPAAWQTYGLLPRQHQFVESLTRARPVILASLGSPYILDEFPQAAAALCTYSDVPVSQNALAAVLARQP
jgi:beta-N-acetylhexosaminidase